MILLSIFISLYLSISLFLYIHVTLYRNFAKKHKLAKIKFIENFLILSESKRVFCFYKMMFAFKIGILGPLAISQKKRSETV